MKTEIRKAFARCSSLALGVVILHVLCWLAGSPMSPCRSQLGHIRGRLISMTVGLWALLILSFCLSVLYERYRQKRNAGREAGYREKQEARAREKEEEKEQFLRRCRELINDHLRTLSRKRGEFVVVDDYGISDRSRWEAEKAYFLDKVLFVGTDWGLDLSRVRKGLRSDRLTPKDVADIDALIEEAIDHAG